MRRIYYRIGLCISTYMYRLLLGRRMDIGMTKIDRGNLFHYRNRYHCTSVYIFLCSSVSMFTFFFYFSVFFSVPRIL